MNFLKRISPIVVWSLPLFVFAQDLEQTVGSIQGVIDAIIPLLIGVGLIVFLWGVLKYVASGDSDDKKKAVGLMIYGIIALFVMVSVWGLVNILQDTLGIDGTSAPDVPEAPRA